MSEKINLLNLKAPGCWINDPNGFIYYRGKYHLFYQCFPYAAFWGTMHWGHAVSKDLIHWEHKGLALIPSKHYDRNGIFSGSAIDVEGRLYLYYTGIVYAGEEPENIHLSASGDSRQCQAMLISENADDFDNFNSKRLLIAPIEDRELADPGDCRDPKVFRHGERFYMCLGSTHEKRRGVLIMYSSINAVDWEYFCRLESDRLGHTLECPDLFKLSGRWLLLGSPMGMWKGRADYDSQALIYNAGFDPDRGELSLMDEGRLLDYGLELYAPQSNTDACGRRVYIAWMRMQRPMRAGGNAAADGRSWNGMMCLPRLLELRDGEIYTPVHPDIRSFFKAEECMERSISGRRASIRDGKGRLFTELSEGEEIEIDGYKISLSSKRLICDRGSLVPEGLSVSKRAGTPCIADSCELEIYWDEDIVEIFVNDGQYVLSLLSYRNAITE